MSPQHHLFKTVFWPRISVVPKGWMLIFVLVLAISTSGQSIETEANQPEVERVNQQQAVKRLSTEQKSAVNLYWALGTTALFLVTLGFAILTARRLKTERELRALEQKERENEKLNQQFDDKNRELSAYAIQIGQKNELLQQLRRDLQELMIRNGYDPRIKEVMNGLKLEKRIDNNWHQFTSQFTELNPAFYKSLQTVATDLSDNDVRLAALLRMNMGTKEIAGMLNLSDEGIEKARYRLRNKLGLETKESLEMKIAGI